MRKAIKTTSASATANTSVTENMEVSVMSESTAIASASVTATANMEGNTMNEIATVNTSVTENMEGTAMNESTAIATATASEKPMKRAVYSEKLIKDIIGAIKLGAGMDVIKKDFNVKTLSTVKGWLSKYYTVKKKLASQYYLMLCENSKAICVDAIEVAKVVESVPQILVTEPVDVEAEASEMAIVAEMEQEAPKFTINSVQAEYPDILVDFEKALQRNSDMNAQLDKEGEKAMLLVDIGSLLFETAETPESAIRTLINILASLAAVSTKNVFCWHKEIMSWKYKTDSELLEKAADLALSYGWFFARNHRINAREYRVISNRAYATFMEVLNPHDVAAISTEDALFSEFNHSEKFSVYKKKNCWTGSERTIRTEFCKAAGLKETDGQLTISPQPVKGYFCVKENETVEFTWETASEIEIWKYEFHEGQFYDVGHRKGGKMAKSLLVKTA